MCVTPPYKGRVKGLYGSYKLCNSLAATFCYEI